VSLTLSDAELVEITGGLTQPAAQLRALHKLGFVRASRPRGGPVVLTRIHYEAIEASKPADAAPEQNATQEGPSVVVGLQAWAASRKGRNGQKTQGR